MVNQVAPSIENTLNDVFSNLYDNYGQITQDVNSAVSELKQELDLLYEDVKSNSVNQEQKGMLENLIRQYKFKETIQFITKNPSKANLNQFLHAYRPNWIDGVEDVVLLEFANVVW